MIQFRLSLMCAMFAMTSGEHGAMMCTYNLISPISDPNVSTALVDSFSISPSQYSFSVPENCVLCYRLDWTSMYEQNRSMYILGQFASHLGVAPSLMHIQEVCGSPALPPTPPPFPPPVPPPTPPPVSPPTPPPTPPPAPPPSTPCDM